MALIFLGSTSVNFQIKSEILIKVHLSMRFYNEFGTLILIYFLYDFEYVLKFL